MHFRLPANGSGQRDEFFCEASTSRRVDISLRRRVVQSDPNYIIKSGCAHSAWIFIAKDQFLNFWVGSSFGGG